MTQKDHEADKELSHTFQIERIESERVDEEKAVSEEVPQIIVRKTTGGGTITIEPPPDTTIWLPPAAGQDPVYHQYGHPRFYEIIDALKQLHSEKNHDYAAGGDPLGNFHRVAKILALYPNLKLSDPIVVAIVYALKQIDAVLWLLSSGHTATVEGVSERLKDVAVYSILQMILNEEKE